MKRWYSKFGPISWYKHQRMEWVRFCLSFKRILVIDLHIHRHSFSILVGGSVIKRSIFGQPSIVEPKIAYYYPKIID